VEDHGIFAADVADYGMRVAANQTLRRLAS
jgi:hypothetical protein